MWVGGDLEITHTAQGGMVAVPMRTVRKLEPVVVVQISGVFLTVSTTDSWWLAEVVEVLVNLAAPLTAAMVVTLLGRLEPCLRGVLAQKSLAVGEAKCREVPVVGPLAQALSSLEDRPRGKLMCQAVVVDTMAVALERM
jgi:hypothetical protein